MEIRAGLSLLQALSRTGEVKPVPFAERLAELRGDAADASKADAMRAEAPTLAEAPTRSAASGAVRPRGSRIDIQV